MVEIFRGQARRRWSEEDKRRLVAETFGPGGTVHGVARRSGLSPSQLFAWRKLYRAGPEIERSVPALPSVPGFAAVEIAPATSPSDADVVSAPSGLIEIELAGGDRVRISGAPDPGVVVAALRALVGR
jgi:transposase